MCVCEISVVGAKMSATVVGLAAFLKAFGYIIPLMDAEYANFFTREVMIVVIREFQSPDEEMKKIVLKVCVFCFLFLVFFVTCLPSLFFARVTIRSLSSAQRPTVCKPSTFARRSCPSFSSSFGCAEWPSTVATTSSSWKRPSSLPTRYSFFVCLFVLFCFLFCFWIRISNRSPPFSRYKVGVAEILGRIVDDLKDESEVYRKMVMETIEKVWDSVIYCVLFFLISGFPAISDRPKPRRSRHRHQDGGAPDRRHPLLVPGAGSFCFVFRYQNS